MPKVELTPEEVDLIKGLCMGVDLGSCYDGADAVAESLFNKLEAIKPDYHPTREDIWQAILLACR